MAWLDAWKQRAQRLERDIHALCLAYRDPRVPLAAKVLAACVVAYALSPIDLVPDFIPVLGYFDDLVLLPAGIALVLRLIPAEVMEEYRRKAQAPAEGGRTVSWPAAAAIVALWLLLALLVLAWFRR